ANCVVLNITVTNPTTASYLTVWPSANVRPVVSNLNFVPGQTVANRVIVRLGAQGQVSIFNAAGSVQVIADIGGWFGFTNPIFTGLTPTRILDTRSGPVPGGTAIGKLCGGCTM